MTFQIQLGSQIIEVQLFPQEGRWVASCPQFGLSARAPSSDEAVSQVMTLLDMCSATPAA